jgi:hypothetical protein
MQLKYITAPMLLADIQLLAAAVQCWLPCSLTNSSRRSKAYTQLHGRA